MILWCLLLFFKCLYNYIAFQHMIGIKSLQVCFPRHNSSVYIHYLFMYHTLTFKFRLRKSTKLINWNVERCNVNIGRGYKTQCLQHCRSGFLTVWLRFTKYLVKILSNYPNFIQPQNMKILSLFIQINCQQSTVVPVICHA